MGPGDASGHGRRNPACATQCVTVEQPATADVFSVPHRTPSELLLFDPQASLFQRVCVSGQIVHVGETENFLMAGSNGLRFVATMHWMVYQTGRSGGCFRFSRIGRRLSGVARCCRAKDRPRHYCQRPESVAATNLNNADLDSTLVRLDGVLVEVRGATNETIFDLQSEGRSFVARLRAGGEDCAPCQPAVVWN